LSGPGLSSVNSQYSVGIGTASYELDLFGRIRSLKKQALENYFATERSPAQRADFARFRGGRAISDRTRI
jgi:outer membrane protein TolC